MKCNPIANVSVKGAAFILLIFPQPLQQEKYKTFSCLRYV